MRQFCVGAGLPPGCARVLAGTPERWRGPPPRERPAHACALRPRRTSFLARAMAWRASPTLRGPPNCATARFVRRTARGAARGLAGACAAPPFAQPCRQAGATDMPRGRHAMFHGSVSATWATKRRAARRAAIWNSGGGAPGHKSACEASCDRGQRHAPGAWGVPPPPHDRRPLRLRARRRGALCGGACPQAGASRPGTCPSASGVAWPRQAARRRNAGQSRECPSAWPEAWRRQASGTCGEARSSTLRRRPPGPACPRAAALGKGRGASPGPASRLLAEHVGVGGARRGRRGRRAYRAGAGAGSGKSRHRRQPGTAAAQQLAAGARNGRGGQGWLRGACVAPALGRKAWRP